LFGGDGRWKKSRPKPFGARRQAVSLEGDVCEGSSSGFLNAPNVKKRFCVALYILEKEKRTTEKKRGKLFNVAAIL
jgi:hypothetical protein